MYRQIMKSMRIFAIFLEENCTSIVVQESDVVHEPLVMCNFVLHVRNFSHTKYYLMIPI